MASRKFRFVSPGVFLREIDNSQLPRQSEAIGPIVIGRSRKGPGMKPYKVKSLEEYERVFGKPMPGNQGEDPWRDGTDLLAEAYAPYAAKAFLTAARDTDAPLTMVRLLGVAGDDAGTGDGEPGWVAQSTHGLFLAKLDANGDFESPLDLNLAAIFYSTKPTADFKLLAKGQQVEDDVEASVASKPVKLDNSGKISLVLSGSSNQKTVRFSFPDIRKEFNTNPVSTNDQISDPNAESLAESYWLGESFDDVYNKMIKEKAANETLAVVAMPLATTMGDFQSTNHGMSSARTGWIFGQDTTFSTTQFDGTQQQRLFRLIALHEGIESSKSLVIGVEDIKVARPGAVNRFGTFSVVVRRIGASRLEVLERFDNCNLDPSSPDFIARKVGDQYYEWSPSEKRNKVYGEHPNVSEYIRVEMNLDIVTQGGPANVEHVPFGFYGPIVPDDDSSTLAIENAVAEVAKITIDSSVVVADVHTDIADAATRKTLTIIQENGAAANLSKTFLLDQSVASNAAAADVIGLQNVPVNNAANIAQHILDKLNADVDFTTLTFELAEVAGNQVITITQGTAGDVVTAATTVAGGKFDIADETPGSDGALNLNPKFSSWVDSNLNLTSTGLAEADTVTVKWPESLPVNVASLEQGYYHGITPFVRTFSSTENTVTSKINRAYVDYVRKLSDHDGSSLVSSQTKGIKDSGKTKYSFVFSLDEVVLEHAPRLSGVNEIQRKGDVIKSYWKAGSHLDTAAEKSYTWHIANGDVADSSKGMSTLLDIVDGFHLPMVGGCDGTNITEADPFNARVVNNQTTSAHYAYASIDRAIELIKDPESVEHNLAVMPGIAEESLTTKLVDVCEARADSMAIIDLPDVYVPPFQQSCDNFQQRIPELGNPENSARNLVNRQLNSSYGATYYPWVKIKDETNNRDVWVPPSVVALGVMGYTENSSDVWFAPAGFNRGGLNQGNAGVPVLQVTEQLLSKDRDTLYAANINPIASFVSEGIVIFGQKTLQSEQSALDRINVRRLLIFVKKEISRISTSLLFEPNVQATWARFHSKAKELLDSVKVRFGLTDYKVLLDNTTTTADLVDRNIMYAKIFLKPARAIEFIAVDFVITNTGAEFGD